MKKLGVIMEWVLAIGVAFFIVNILSMFYYKSPGFMKRDTGATNAIWYPDSSYIIGYEGYGVNHIDENGYVNESGSLADEYILVMGSSQTEGLHVNGKQNYTSLLNSYYGSGDDLAVYNIARSGRTWLDIISGFSASLEEFPNSDAIIIEIGNTDFYAGELEAAMQQRVFEPQDIGMNLVEQQNPLSRIKIFAERNLPLLYYLYDVQLKDARQQLQNWCNGFANDSVGYTNSTVSNVTNNEKSYSDATREILSFFRERYEGTIIILYLPAIEIDQNGKMNLIYDAFVEQFATACDECDIEFLDPGKAYLDAYENDHIVPYGFSNTSMGTGHLNQDGNQIIYELLIDTLEGK